MNYVVWYYFANKAATGCYNCFSKHPGIKENLKKLNLKVNIKNIIGLLLITITSLGYAQTAAPVKKPVPVLLDEQKDLQMQLLPLDSILELAVKNSPGIKFQKDLIQSAQAQLEFTKDEWTSNIVGFVNYTAGNQTIVTNDNQPAGSLSQSNINNGFKVGIQVNLPLYEFIGHRAKNNLYKYELNSTIDKRDQSIQELRTVVIQAYYNLFYTNNLLTIRSEAKQSAINEYAIAQKQFRDGTIDISELSRIETFQVNASAEYEDAKRQFSTAFSQIEPLVGVPVKQLMVNR